MKVVNWMVFVYGALVLLGGLIGFATAHSLASLIMGVAFATGIITSSLLMFKGKRSGHISALALSGLLSFFFAYRFILTVKFFPAGIMCILSLLVFIVLFKKR